MAIKFVLLVFALLIVGLVARLVLIKLNPRSSTTAKATAHKQLQMAFWLPPVLIVAAAIWFVIKVALAFYFK